jgi:hypothetical protein
MMTATTWCLGSTVVTRRGRSNSLPDQILNSDCPSSIAPRTVAIQAFEMADYRTWVSRLLPVGSPENQQTEIGIYQASVAETAAADQTQGVSAMAYFLQSRQVGGWISAQLIIVFEGI